MLTINPFRAMPQQKQNHQKQHSPAFKGVYLELEENRFFSAKTPLIARTLRYVQNRIERAVSFNVFEITDTRAEKLIDGRWVQFELPRTDLVLTGKDAVNRRESIQTGANKAYLTEELNKMLAPLGIRISKKHNIKRIA